MHERGCDRFPPLANILADFAAAGFVTTAVESFAQPTHRDLAAYHDALKLGPQSKFDQLTETEFTADLADLAHDASLQATPRPVSERYDALVFTTR